MSASMSEMLRARLGDLCQFKAGDAFKRQFQGRETGDYPFIKVSDMNLNGNEISITRSVNWVDQGEVANNRYRLHEAGSVVFAKIGVALTYNRRRILRQPTIIDNNMMAAKPDGKEVNERYFYYLLSTLDFNEIASGSALPYLTQKDLQSIELSLHQMPEQIRVASLLGALDDKIELNGRMNETLEAMARAIFKDWFVDFGPTRAKAEGRAPYLAPELWELFPDALDDSDKPSGWRNGKLNDLIVLQRGFDLPKPKRVKGKFPILAASGVNGTHNEAKVPGPGVTTGRSGVIGKAFYVHEDFWPLNTSLWVKQYRNSSPAHAYFLIQTLDFASFNSGSVVPTLNRNHVHDLPMAVPRPETIQGFDSFIGPLLQRQRLNDVENIALACTRDYLLPKLMSGEVRLRDAEQIVEAVA